jgi:tetratricopeptide (TPR) repeat protein
MKPMSTDRAGLGRGGSARKEAILHTTPDSEGHHGLAHWHILFAVLAATLVAYARTLSFDFVYDDFSQLVTNPAIHSWKYLPEYFSKNVWAEAFPGVQGNYYRPVFLLWCRINDALFGSQTGMWHFTTVLAHLVVTALVYFLVLRLVRDRLTAGMASLIFGLHPAHIEAVAWVSAVTEPLLGVFFLSAFLCYLGWREDAGKARMWLALALFLYAMGMLEKETAVVLPLLIAAHAWLYAKTCADGRRETFYSRARNALRAAAPFLLLTVVYLIARIAALKGFSHDFAPIPWAWVFYTWPSLLWFWVKHLIAPVGLGSNYNLRTVDHPGLMNFVLPVAALAGVAAAMGWFAKRSRHVALACLWMLLPLLPLLDIRILAPDDVAHDRYLYLPLVGFSILVALAIRRIGRAADKAATALQPVQILVAVVLATALGIGTWTQSFYFENNWIFYRYNYFLAPSNPYAVNNYGALLARLGMLDEALQVLKRGHEENPGYWSLAYNLGRDYYMAHKPELAAPYLLKAIQIDPTKADAFYCLGLAQRDSGHPQEAEAALRQALRLKPNGQQYHYQLALALRDQGKLKEALEEFRKDEVGSLTYLRSRQQIKSIEGQLHGKS